MEIEIHINEKMAIDVGIDEIIDGINNKEMAKRWNYVANILNGVKNDSSDLTDEQRAIIKKYLTDKLALF